MSLHLFNSMLSHYVLFLFFFFFKQKTAYEIMPSLVGSEMCIRDRVWWKNLMSLRQPIPTE